MTSVRSGGWQVRVASVGAIVLVALAGMLLTPRPAEAAPGVLGVAPALGPAAGGTAVTITGSGFVAGATVTFGGAPATGVVVASATSITAVTPAGTAGVAVVTVTNPDTLSGSLGGAFTYQFAPPTASIAAPGTGSSAGGTSITVTGTAFRAGATVTVGGTAATNVVVVSATSITAVTPPHAIGTFDVVVANSDAQSATVVGAFTYTAASAPTVTSIAPTSGSVGGGTAVTITGTGFVAGSAVTFGGLAATSVVVVSATSITAVTPAGAALGAVSAVVTNPDTQTGTRVNGYTYVPRPAPTVTSVSPSAGVAAGGTSITVTGTGFYAGAMVAVGGAGASSVVVVSATSITAVTGLRTAGATTVTVTNADGQSATGGTFTYSANAAPVISSIAPDEGTVAGGTVVTITGTGFLAGAAVTFDGVAGTVTAVTATSIVVTTPAHVKGAVAVLVANYDQQTVTSTGGFEYVVPAGPSITKVEPAGVTLGKSAVVTVTGTGFAPFPTATLGGVSVQAYYTNATTLTIVVPARDMPGAVDLVVTADGVPGELKQAFSYYFPAPLVAALSADSGAVAGGTVLTITGKGFGSDVTVKFGGVAASKVTRVSETELTVTTPVAKEAATVDVVVAHPNSQAATLTSGFTYFAPGKAAVASTPPVGGIVLVVSGTSDLQALIKAQRFPVKAVFYLDVARQEWRTYIVGAPVVANTLKSVKATDILMLRR